MGIININRANAIDLQMLNGIGRVRAELIIKGRPYRDVYELSKVKGLGKKRMESLIWQGIVA